MFVQSNDAVLCLDNPLPPFTSQEKNNIVRLAVVPWPTPGTGSLRIKHATTYKASSARLEGRETEREEGRWGWGETMQLCGTSGLAMIFNQVQGGEPPQVSPPYHQ